jgi:hypothetical protein
VREDAQLIFFTCQKPEVILPVMAPRVRLGQLPSMDALASVAEILSLSMKEHIPTQM